MELFIGAKLDGNKLPGGKRCKDREVVFIRGKYYIAKWYNIADEFLYAVFINDNYWRNIIQTKYVNKDKDKCIEWINNRRCFK